MSISLKPSSVSADAPVGTIVGTLSESRFLARSYTALFSGNLLSVVADDVVTLWQTPPAPGNYNLYILVFGYGLFQIDLGTVTVTIAPGASQIGIDLENVYTKSQAIPENSGP